MSATIGEAISYLQSTQATDGSTLFNQLSAILSKILDEKPGAAIDLLESTLLAAPATLPKKDPVPMVSTTSAADAAGAVAAASLYGYPDALVDPDTGEAIEQDASNEYECEDVVADGVLFDQLGVGLGLSEMQSVMLAVKKLGEDAKRGVATVRFFGKFFGLNADYYVFETTLKDPPDENFPPDEEGKPPIEVKTGANGFFYYVSNRLGGPMTLLPSVTPNQIKAAREIKRFLTGRLNAHVSTYPAFPGNESNFLRAQIARIAATTVCCPAKVFELTEDGELAKPEEPEPLLPGRDMASPVNWCHRYPHLKKQGRCELWKREAPEDEEETFPWTEEELEEGKPLLTTLDQDDRVNNKFAWSPLYSSSNENVKSQVGGVRSNLWPGAFCAAQGEHFANVYVGWGLKNIPFIPPRPPSLAQEFYPLPVESVEMPPKPAPPEVDADE